MIKPGEPWISQADWEVGGLTFQLKKRTSGGGQVERIGAHTWRMAIPAGTGSVYRLAQLDDTSGLTRMNFAHRAPSTLAVRARVSAAGLPGTWGFGFWNEPFGAGVGKGVGLRLPTLPNAAWFFHASPANALSLRDDLPAHGYLAQAFRSPPAWPFYPLAPGLALLAWPAAARLLRRLGQIFVREESITLSQDEIAWHTYRIECTGYGTHFAVDGQPVLDIRITPRGRLGFVMWIDNQYAAFTPGGRIRAGTEENKEAAWMEVEIDE
jgi:hypothetical protein